MGELDIAALGGHIPPPNRPQEGQAGYLPVIAEPYSCIIFTPDEAARWYSSEGGKREISSDPDMIYFRRRRAFFGMECVIEIMDLEPVKKLFQQYYLNAKPEEDKRIIQDTMVGVGGGVSASMSGSQGGGYKKKKRRKSNKNRKSKTRRRRRR